MTSARARAFASSVVVLVSGAGLCAQVPVVRIVQVPAVVVLPAAPGQNLLLEVECAGMAVELVAEGRRGSVRFAPAGPDRWQCNLGAPEVEALVGPDAPSGKLHATVLLGLEGLQSAPIVWTRGPLPPPGLACRAQMRGANAIEGVVHGSVPLDPEQLAAVEVLLPVGSEGLARLRCSGNETPLAASDVAGRLRLPIDEAWRARFGEAGSFAVDVELAAGRFSFRFSFPPRAIEAARLGGPFAVQQRRTGAIPGSRDLLTVAVDDITFGSTHVGITAPGTCEIAATRSTFEGDWVEFALHDGRYVLVVDRLVNVLFGEDHADLRVVAKEDFEPDPIAVLIRRVAASPHAFVRGEMPTTGAVTAKLLAARLASERRHDLSLDRFVDEVASRPDKQGAEYLVRRADGTETTMREWLRAELQAYEKERAQKR